MTPRKLIQKGFRRPTLTDLRRPRTSVFGRRNLRSYDSSERVNGLVYNYYAKQVERPVGVLNDLHDHLSRVGVADRIAKISNVCGGKACIAGHRIRVMDIVFRHEDLGMSPDAIVADYPELRLSDVHAALAYYFDNVDEIRNDISRNDDVAEQLRASFPSKLKPKLLIGAD